MVDFGAIVGALALAAAVIVPIWQSKKQSQKKQLIIDPVSINLIDLDSQSKKSVKERLKVLWDDQLIRKLDVTEIKILNRRQSIDESDFKQPLEISFDKAKILHVETIEKGPEKLQIIHDFDASKVTISISLINKGEFFIIKVITDNLGGVSDISAGARIKNGEVINQHKLRSERVFKLMDIIDEWVGYLAIPLGTIVFFWFFSDDMGLNITWNEKTKDFLLFMSKMFGTVIVTATVFILVFSILPRKIFERRK